MRKSFKILILLGLIGILGFAFIMITKGTTKSNLQSGVVTDGCPAGQARSIQRFNITWFFSGCYTYGQFVNGDYWVRGPVTITSITPQATLLGGKAANGSMLNPIPNANQGFRDDPFFSLDSTRYNSSLNAALQLPLTIQGNSSLVSSVWGNYNFATEPGGLVSKVETLTVLSDIPAEGSFRPSIYGSGQHSVKYNINQLNWNVLKNVATVSGAPSKAAINALLPEGTWMEWSGNFSGAHIGPSAQMNIFPAGNGAPSNYGREIAWKWGKVGLWLNTANTQADKRYATIQTIQAGIDIASYLQITGSQGLYHDGGHKAGRKLPVLIAGLMLNATEIKNIASNNSLFQEDTQTFFVTQADVGRILNCSNKANDQYRVQKAYIDSDIGLADWGIRHRSEPCEDNKIWSGAGVTNYRHVVWPAMIGSVAAAKIMGQETAWNYPPIFTYTQRYISLSGFGGDAFVQNMWNTYISKTQDPIHDGDIGDDDTPLSFGLGNKVRVESSTVNIRALPSIQGFLRGAQSQGSSGIILDGPRQGDGYTWWYVNYDSGVDGWVGENTHSVTAASVATPGAQYTLTSIGTHGAITGNLGNYRNGVIAYLAATPDTGYEFVSWTGCTHSTGNICEVTMTSNKTATATFTAVPTIRVCKPWN